MAINQNFIPPHWSAKSVEILREDRIRLFRLAIGWDHLRLCVGCYWFMVDICWMCPVYDFGVYQMALGAEMHIAWNTRRRNLTWGSDIWEQRQALVPRFIQQRAEF